MSKSIPHDGRALYLNWVFVGRLRRAGAKRNKRIRRKTTGPSKSTSVFLRRMGQGPKAASLFKGRSRPSSLEAGDRRRMTLGDLAHLHPPKWQVTTTDVTSTWQEAQEMMKMKNYVGTLWVDVVDVTRVVQLVTDGESGTGTGTQIAVMRQPVK